MRIIVTGAAGFIGSHVAEALLARGDSVLGIDEVNDYYDPRQKEANLTILSRHKKFSFKRLDIRDAEALTAAFAAFKPDKVVHLAARAGVRPSIEQPRLYYEVNVLGTLNVLEAMRATHVRDLVAASSSSVYGSRTPKSGAFKEDDRVDTPISPYAASKKAMEELCHAYHALHDLNIILLRFFTVYGPRGRPDMALYKFLDALHRDEQITVYGSGDQVRDFTFIDDVVNANVLAAVTAMPPGQVFNVAGGTSVSVNESLALLESLSGRPLRVNRVGTVPGDVAQTGGSTERLRLAVGWEPSVSFEVGLAAQLDWGRRLFGTTDGSGG